ncbi:hypothetical protein SAMN05216414_10554 [Nitrosovibrio sp. Nv17]|nr:hypothetical protein SAMN05216414_10554 [Nitrosovibrio sp. Nv17]
MRNILETHGVTPVCGLPERRHAGLPWNDQVEEAGVTVPALPEADACRSRWMIGRMPVPRKAA